MAVSGQSRVRLFPVEKAVTVGSTTFVPMSATLFFSQIIGPAQIFCRAYLSGRHHSDPREQVETLIACAIRAVVAPGASERAGGTS